MSFLQVDLMFVFLKFLRCVPPVCVRGIERWIGRDNGIRGIGSFMNHLYDDYFDSLNEKMYCTDLRSSRVVTGAGVLGHNRLVPADADGLSILRR